MQAFRHAVRHGGHKGLCIRRVGKDAVFQQNGLDWPLGQAQKIARARAAILRVHISESDAAYARRAVIHRLRLAALHIGAVAVRVAKVQAVDHKRRADAAHLHMVKHNAVDHGVFTAPAPGFHAQAAVGVAHQAVAHAHVFDAARALAAGGYAAVAILHQAMGDVDILAGRAVARAHVDLAGFDGDAIVPHGEMHARHRYLAAAFGIKAVGIGAAGRRVDGQIGKDQVLAEIGMQIPRGAVAKRKALHGYLPAAAQKQQPWPPRAAPQLGVLPPVAQLRLPVHHAGADDAHILYIHAGQCGGEAIQRVALPAAQQKILLRGKGNARQDGEAAAVRAEHQPGALLQLDGDVAFQKQGGDAVVAAGDAHAPACGTAVDGRLNGGGIIVHAVARRAKAAHVKRHGFLLRAEGYGPHLL